MSTLNDVNFKRCHLGKRPYPYIHISLLGQDITADVLSEDQLYPHKRVRSGNHVRLCGVSVFCPNLPFFKSFFFTWCAVIFS